MQADAQATGKAAKRPPETVMRLARMGAFHQSRLSFMRILLRRMQREGWRFERRAFDIDARGVGHAVYAAHGPRHSYSLVAFAHDLPAEKRSDRVIADAWDATFALFDGLPEQADIDRLAANVPLQEAGRISGRELSLSRANRSVRLFEHVVGRLAEGRQPDPETVGHVGYLMRTTAVYGSGKFGAADRDMIADRPEFAAPFQAEMLSVYLTRWFVIELAEHLARARAPGTAVAMAPAMRRRFGIGNSTGLGMAPFLITHPVLINNWIAAREEALARVRSLTRATPEAQQRFRALLARAVQNAAEWQSEHPLQIGKLAALRADLDRLRARVDNGGLDGTRPWDALYRWAEDTLSLEGQEQLVSLVLEPYGDLVDKLSDCMGADEAAAFCIDGAMTVAELRATLQDVYGWALEIDWQAPPAQARCWYVSEEKLEPRLGERFDEPVTAYEQPLSPGRDAARLYADLAGYDPDAPLAELLLALPVHRHMVRRAQIATRFPYAEIRDNTIGADVLPIDMLRAKLSFFGATHFDPRSDRWVRINMYRGAPYPDELAGAAYDDWAYPVLPETAS
ncbi:hypothetical protein DDZ14_04180 [Maritimibacter sp. 55A14]|uniref:hypothetical protein n=1 Tax=Maritimibacter sp. 55A14 TaxID=2174844 RepID=UPI000D61F773|nr:hypothetical protein [Maritimibacter sp. 55A14]PWE33863.1 hypothetical protein DDZ14_04180 [Maritimibacter sp. 55A14]